MFRSTLIIQLGTIVFSSAGFRYYNWQSRGIVLKLIERAFYKMTGSEIDTTGVVTKLWSDRCHVSLTIDNAQRTFSCSKFLVYLCGYQCEGQLTALLDAGADVQVRYRSNEKDPSIVAVWCGEVPDHLSNGAKRLRAYYDQKGHIVAVSGDSFLVQNDDGNHNVLINKEVIFREGCRVENSSGLFSINDSVTFDAIPFETKHPSGALYQATCAWVGQTPQLCQRFGLQALTLLEDPWDSSNPADLVHGVVTVVANEVVAFAEADFAPSSSKVILMRSSFAQGCSNIKDMVNVGDTLCMQVRFGYMFRNTRQWFAVLAWKDGREVSDEITDGRPCLAGPSVVGEVMADSARSVAEVAAVWGEEQVPTDLHIERDSGNNSSGPASVRKRTRVRRRVLVRRAPDDPVEMGPSTGTGEGSTESAQENLAMKFDEKSPVLKANPPLTGLISIATKDTALILYEGLKIAVDQKNLFLNGKPCSSAEFVLLLTTEIREVRFEAVKTSLSKYIELGCSHQATCVWVGQKPSVSTMEAFFNAPEESKPQPKTGIKKVASQPAEVKFDETSPVLYHDPPLHGIVTNVSRQCASVFYNDLSIYVSYENCYTDVPREQNSSGTLHLGQVVHFEAVRTDRRYGHSHEATCVWVKAKPSLTTVLNTLPPMKFSLLEEKNRILFGKVRKFCLPKVALVVVDDRQATVCLHVSAFGCRPKKTVDYTSGKDFINHFVKIGYVVRFRVIRLPMFFNVVSATDVEVLGAVLPKTSASDIVNRLSADATFISSQGKLDRIISEVQNSGIEMRGDICTGEVNSSPLPTEISSRNDREDNPRLKIPDNKRDGCTTF